MPNIVEIIVRTTDDTSKELAKTEQEVKSSANRQKSTWDDLASHAKTAMSGAFKGVGMFAGASALLSIASPLGAATAALGTFAAVAIPELSKVNDAFSKTGKAGQEAMKQLSPAERELGQGIQGLKASFSGLEQAMVPVLTAIVGMGSKILGDAMPAITVLAKAGGQVIMSFLTPLEAFVKSATFSTLIGQIAKFAQQVAALAGPIMVQLLQQLLTLFVQLMPSGIKMLQVLLPLFVQIVADLSPVIVMVAKATAAFLDWATKTGMLKPILLGLVPVVMLLVGSTGIGAIAIAVSLLIAGIVELAKNWQQIWTNIKGWTTDAVNVIKRLFDGLPAPLRAVLTAYATMWKVQFDIIIGTVKTAAAIIEGALKTAWAIIQGVTKTAWDAIAGVFKAAWAVIQGVFKAAIALLTGNWTAFNNAVKNSGIQAWNAIKNALIGIWNAMRNSAVQVFNAMKSTVQGVWNAMRSTAQQVWNAISGAARSTWNTISSTVVGIVRGLVNNVVSTIGTINGKITSIFKGAGNWLYSFGRSIITGLLSGIKSIWQSVVNFFLTVPKAILNALGIHSPPDWAIDAGKHIMNGLGIGVTMAKKVVSEATAKQIQQAAINGVSPGNGPANAGAAQAQAYARSRLGAYGWGSGQMGPLISLWNQESGWNRLARNPSSGAYGIPQALPASKMGAAANPPTSSASAQIDWGLGYIKGRYGSPAGAWAHEVANNWYAGGGATSAGWAVVGERGRELVKLPGGASVTPAGATSQAIAGAMLGAGGVIQLEISSSGQGAFDKFMLEWMRNNVRIKGGGSVQKAFGQPGR